MECATYFITFRLQHGELAPNERQIILDHITDGDPAFYRLFAAVIMPDHIHLIAKPNPGINLSRLTKGIKGVTARKINQTRKTSGSVCLAM